MHRKWNICARLWNTENSSNYNGEEIKYKSFLAKDTAYLFARRDDFREYAIGSMVKQQQLCSFARFFVVG
jgi:hypothetical protein